MSYRKLWYHKVGCMTSGPSQNVALPGEGLVLRSMRSHLDHHARIQVWRFLWGTCRTPRWCSLYPQWPSGTELNPVTQDPTASWWTGFKLESAHPVQWVQEGQVRTRVWMTSGLVGHMETDMCHGQKYQSALEGKKLEPKKTPQKPQCCIAVNCLDSEARFPVGKPTSPSDKETEVWRPYLTDDGEH